MPEKEKENFAWKLENTGKIFDTSSNGKKTEKFDIREKKITKTCICLQTQILSTVALSIDF